MVRFCLLSCAFVFARRRERSEIFVTPVSHYTVLVSSNANFELFTTRHFSVFALTIRIGVSR